MGALSSEEFYREVFHMLRKSTTHTESTFVGCE